MNVYRNYVNVFVKEWPVLELLPLKQAVMLVKILPYIESITASLKKIEQILSILLDIPVHLKEGKRAVTHVDRQMIPPLGKCRLGSILYWVIILKMAAHNLFWKLVLSQQMICRIFFLEEKEIRFYLN